MVIYVNKRIYKTNIYKICNSFKVSKITNRKVEQQIQKI